MTKDHSFFSADANSSVRASPGEVMTLGLIAGVILAALATTVTAMVIASKMPGAFWAAFSIGVVFGVACVVGAIIIGARRNWPTRIH
jgi:predicted lysophospholipase L1 biosynthesis ABC-type transport system permease subunit